MILKKSFFAAFKNKTFSLVVPSELSFYTNVDHEPFVFISYETFNEKVCEVSFAHVVAKDPGIPTKRL